MYKNIITLLAAAAIILIGTKCFAQEPAKRYPGYKFPVPSIVKVVSLGGTGYILLQDTLSRKGSRVKYKGRYIAPGKIPRYIVQNALQTIGARDSVKLGLNK